MGTYLSLDNISSYKAAFGLSNEVWDVVQKWDWFDKKTVGAQFVSSVDSISANIAEGFGRYSKKDKVRFYRTSFGSLLESIDWLQKARVRKLVSDNDYEAIGNTLKILPKEINYLIKFTNERLKE